MNQTRLSFFVSTIASVGSIVLFATGITMPAITLAVGALVFCTLGCAMIVIDWAIKRGMPI